MTNGKVLITGASGLLGRYLIKTNPGYELVRCRNKSVMPTGYVDMDITNPYRVYEIMRRYKPDVVIHCAAIGSVDFCETHFHYAHEVNVVGTWNVMKAAKDINARFVFISSNAIYDGYAPPYDNRSEQFPVNVYGLLKKQAEAVVSFHSRYERSVVSVRPIMLYGWPNPEGRTNFVKMVVDALRRGKKFHVLRDVHTQPTYALDCAKAIWQLVLENRSGSYNIAGPDFMDLEDFAHLIAVIFGLDMMLIESVDASYFSDMAQRPRNTTYKRDDIISMLNTSAGLEHMRQEMIID